MSTSKQQRIKITAICICGCNTEFNPFPLYTKNKGSGLRIPKYIRGHHPNCHKSLSKKGQTSWNKGLTKETNSGVARQGVTGPKHWNHDPEKNPDWFAEDFDYVAFSKKFGLAPRSKGGNKTYAKFRRAIMKRDNFACQHCDMVADGMEESDLLNVHHIVFIKHDKTRIFDPNNVVTLCYSCHRKVHRKSKKAAPI